MLSAASGRRRSYDLDWSATAPISGESMVPSTVEKARTSDKATDEGIDQPNCATELLNNKGANTWSAMLLKLLRQQQNQEQTRRVNMERRIMAHAPLAGIEKAPCKRT